MRLNTYLHFNGNCEAAFKFYEQLLGGKITALMDYDAAPGQPCPAGMAGKVMHTRLEINGQALMASDCPPEYFAPQQGFYINLDMTDPAEAERIFNALADNGKVQMAFGQTFWAYRFGMVVDQFGTPWMVNCEKPE